MYSITVKLLRRMQEKAPFLNLCFSQIRLACLDKAEQPYLHMHAPEPTLCIGCDSLLVNVAFHRISDMIIFSKMSDNSSCCV